MVNEKKKTGYNMAAGHTNHTLPQDVDDLTLTGHLY